MAFFNAGRISPSTDRIHDHSTDAQDGADLAPDTVAVSVAETVGNSNPNTAQRTTLSNDGSIQVGYYLSVPVLQPAGAIGVSASGTKDDWAPSSAWGYASAWRITPTAALTIRGFDSAPGGVTIGEQFLLLFNLDTANSITLKHQNTNSLAVNRLICPGAADYVIGPQAGVGIWRDTQTQRWRVVDLAGVAGVADHAHTASGDGGGLVSPPQLDVAGIEFTPSVINLGAIPVAQNDVAIGSVRIVQAAPSGASRAINGMVKTADYQRVTISNTDTTNTLNINHNNAGSSAANRFYCPGAVTYALTPFSSVEVYYDPTASRWRVVGH